MGPMSSSTRRAWWTFGTEFQRPSSTRSMSQVRHRGSGGLNENKEKEVERKHLWAVRGNPRLLWCQGLVFMRDLKNVGHNNISLAHSYVFTEN